MLISLRVLSTAVVIGGLAFLAVHWSALPERIPTHFDFGGRADAWGGRGSLIVLAAAFVLLHGLLTVLQFFPGALNYPIEPTAANRRRAETIAVQMLAWLDLIVSALLGYLIVGTVQIAMRRWADLGAAFVPVVLLTLFGTIVVHLIRLMRVLRST